MKAIMEDEISEENVREGGDFLIDKGI